MFDTLPARNEAAGRHLDALNPESKPGPHFMQPIEAFPATPEEYVPGGQSRHADAPSNEYDATSHRKQEDDSKSDEYVPAVQYEQLLEFGPA